MKNTTYLFVILFFTASPALFGQDKKTGSNKKFEIQDISFQTGFFLEQGTNATTADFKALAPQSDVLTENFSGYKSYPYYYSYNGYNSMNFNNMDSRNNVSPMASVLLGIKINKKEGESKFNRLLRVGLAYYSKSGMTSGLYKSERTTMDIFTSGQTGQTVFLDSVSLKTMNINYASQQLRLDGSMIFRTDPEKRWSIYTGFGITLGMSFNATTDIYSTKSNWLESRLMSENIDESSPYHRNNEDMVKESFRNKSNFGASAFIPIGIDHRLGKKRDLWKHLHLFAELRPGISINSIPELRTMASGSIQNTIGVKYSIN
jgi:hypothetical protein